MIETGLPEGYRFEALSRAHSRSTFRSGEIEVDEWLKSKALQNQVKHLSATKVLLDRADAIAGYFTLATGQVSFAELPNALRKDLPRRELPVAVLAWLGVSIQHQRRGLGRLLLAKALRDSLTASHTFPFVAVVLDCINQQAKDFYRRWDFAELPGHPFRLYLSAKSLAAMFEARHS